ncbi:hypothetical protein DQ04_01241120 [Trypanosoma grayi]|uniref:hypothetical protein n=1 Tax=Trypanosoma grayi TaxID=71804 RepID=UPI0004F43AF6|nr:hypothetical protein DQ04_01241120 [Trypanosoma grayi]KEG13057.1 hypothetical protein DQ04_01241120 [Trypanosoma grayi]
MAADTVHRRLNKYEWSENTSTKGGASPQPSGAVKEVLGSAMACSEKKVYLCGGYDPRTGRSLPQLMEFDLSTKQWSKGLTLPERLRNASAVAFGDYCLVFGGWNDETYSKNLWLLAPKSQDMAATNNKEPLISVWTLVRSTGLTPSARVCHSMVLGTMGGEEDASQNPVVYVFGGFDGERRLNDVWRLRLGPLLEKGEATWELIEAKGGTPPSPRDDAAVAFDGINERILVFGGFASCLQSDLHILTLRGGENTWMCQPCLGVPSRRQGCVAAMSNGYLVVCLGEDEKGPIPQILQLSMADFKWSLLSLEKEELSGRRGCVGCASERGKRIVVFGGGVPPKTHTSLLELELEKSDASSSRKK